MNLNDKKDEIIRRKMREQATDIPESFRDHIRTLVQEVSAEPKAERRKYPVYKIAVLFFAACLLCSGTSYAGVKLYQQRLQEMSKTERKELNDKTQKSYVDAEAYSRDLTEAENKMFDQLREEYENGKFPEGELLTVEKTADVPEVSLVYCYENSTFYLPEQELSEQQILEIIDFRYKRDYALIAENREEQPTSRPLDPNAEQQRLWESQAKDFMEYFFGLSVQNIQYSEPEVADGAEGMIEMACSSKDWDYSYILRMNAQTGEISDMGFDIDVEPYLNSEISINEPLYQSRREELIENVETFYHKKVKKLTLYYNHVDGKLSRGNTKYVACLDDDTTIVMMYSEKLNRIYSLYVTDYKIFQNFQRDSHRAAKMRGHKVKKVELY
ncbi:MAG: hypothetical protein K2K70_13475 [Lachnospiraceae bacterium]|nr:hypothetical protein [Lachnospiraceae bacterium]